MKSAINFSIIGLLLICSISCGKNKSGNADQAPGEARNTPIVQVANPQKHEFSGKLQLTGTAKPNETVKLFAMTSGFLTQLRADIGDFVKEGQTLALLENPELQREKQRLEALVHEKGLLFERLKNTPDLSRTGADLKGKKAIYERLKSVFEKTPHLTSAADVERAQAEYESAKALLIEETERAEAELQSLQAQLQAVVQQINYLTVKAPFSGIVVNRFADRGAVLQNGLSHSGSMPLFELQSIQPIRLQMDVPETDAILVGKGTKTDIVFPELPGGKFSASVSRIAYGLNETTKTMRAEIDLPNRDLKIRSGMYAKIEIQRGGHREALAVPNEAVGNLKGQSFVWAVRDGRAKKVEVKTGIRDQKMTEILQADLKTDDLIVVKGKESCSDGAAVETKLLTNQ